eukprot:jgi/Botrbrau1/10871/Bobra.0025s0048.1
MQPICVRSSPKPRGCSEESQICPRILQEIDCIYPKILAANFCTWPLRRWLRSQHVWYTTYQHVGYMVVVWTWFTLKNY